METKVFKFLADNGIEFTEVDDHIATHKKLPFSDKDMEALSKFWTMPVFKNDSGNWVLNGIEVKVY